MYSSSGAFAAPNEPCPFRCIPLSDEETNALDAYIVSLVKASDADALVKIYLPKQLQLDDGAEDLLQWFKDTSSLPGPGGVRDSKCASAAAASRHAVGADMFGMRVLQS